MQVTLYGQEVTMPTAYLDLLNVNGTIARTVSIDFGISSASLANATYTYNYIIGVAGLGGLPTESSTVTSSQR